MLILKLSKVKEAHTYSIKLLDIRRLILTIHILPQGYDVFAITQRGMEGTTPSLNCDNSKLPETCPPEGCQAWFSGA